MTTILEFQDGEVISKESILKKIQEHKTTDGSMPYILIDKDLLPPLKDKD